MPLRIQTRRIEPDILVLEFAGEFTLPGAEGHVIEALLTDLLRQDQKKFIFDLTGVEHIDSTGVGIIAYLSSMLRRARAGLRLAGASTEVQRKFQATRLDTVLPLYPTVAAACEGFAVTP